MNPWEKYVLPRLIDSACAQPPMQRLRSRYVSRARGDVLEIGIGSGLNLPFYGPDVKSVTGVDPHARLNEMARERAARINAPVDVLGVSGEALEADDNRFDTVVCTWTLCSIPNPYRAVAEMFRVLRPGGELLFAGTRDRPMAAPRGAVVEDHRRRLPPDPARRPADRDRRLRAAGNRQRL